MPANVLITPASGQIDFLGSASGTTSIKTLSDSTLSFEANTGQLFSINNNLSSGKIWSVNDISGLPSLDVDADGTVRITPYGGATQIGSGGNTIFATDGSISKFNGGTMSITFQGSGVNGLNINGLVMLGGTGSVDYSTYVASNCSIGWSALTGVAGAISDTRLYRDAADTIAQRRGVNAQTFRIYETYTDASNYARLSFSYSTGLWTIQPEAAGTGTARRMKLIMGDAGGTYIASTSTNSLDFYAGGTIACNFTNGVPSFMNYWFSGQLKAINLGQSNSGNTNRDSDSYVIRSRGGSGSGLAGYIGFGAAIPQASGTTAHVQEDVFLCKLPASSAGVYAFGSSFANTVPALIRSGTTLKARLADDSGDAPITASYVKTVPVTVATLPSAATAGNGARAFVTDSNATHSAGLGNTVVGGGSNNVPVYSNGTNWLIG